MTSVSRLVSPNIIYKIWLHCVLILFINNIFAYGNSISPDLTSKGSFIDKKEKEYVPIRWRGRRSFYNQNQRNANDGADSKTNTDQSQESISCNDHLEQPLSRDEEYNEKLDIRKPSTQFVAECVLPTPAGKYRMRSYRYQSASQNLEPIAMIYGQITDEENILVRVHDQCLTSEVFGSLRCDCQQQLQESLRIIREQGGIVIYLQQEGRGIGIANKVAAYALQDKGMDTVDANTHLGFPDEMREYQAVPDILQDLGVKSIRLLTNNPYKVQQLSKLGVDITERVPLMVAPNIFSRKYLQTKKDKMQHMLTSAFDDSDATADMEQQSGKEATDDSNIDQAFSYSGEPVEYALGRDSVVAAIDAIREGKVVIVVDDANRENEGDFIMAAEKATEETIAYIVRYSSGVLCISLESDRLEALALPPMVVNNEDPKKTAYTISVDCVHNTTTGISASDRAITFRKLVDPLSTRYDFHRPGHVFPLAYKKGGVLSRMGHTEASLDLSRLAGLRPGGVLAEVVHDDGRMMRLPELKLLAEEHNLVLTSVQDIKAFRVETEFHQTRTSFE